MTLDEVTSGLERAEKLVDFDYNALACDTQSLLQQHTLEIKENLRETISIIWSVGRKLFEIRNLLKSGCFKAWLETEFRWSRPTAYNYINVYKAFPDLISIRDLPIDSTALYRLAARSTPETARLEAVELAAAGERITLKAAKTLIGSKTHKSVTSNTKQITPVEDKEITDVIAHTGEKESSENYLAEGFPNAVTINLVAQTMPSEEILATEAPMSSPSVEETHEETIFVPSEVNSAATTYQSTNTSGSSPTPAYNQTPATFTPDSSSTTTNYQSSASYTYNACRSLIANLELLTNEEVFSILGAFMQKVGLSTIGNFVKQLQQEEIASLCNQCFTSLNQRGLKWLDIEKINFAALSDTLIKSLSSQLKRILLSRATQRVTQSQTPSEPSNLMYIAR